jgi:hypothetical protein
MTAEEHESLMIDGTHVDARDQIAPTFIVVERYA